MRAIWSGSINFGLVNIPVKLYSAVSDERIDFDMLHEKDLSPIRFARVCKAEEKEVPYEEIVKGFEYQKGRYVVLSDDDFDRANIRISKAIVILDFVDEGEVDPIYFEKPYYLEPDKNSGHPYALLSETLKRSGRMGIGKYVLRNREHLVGLKQKEGLLILEQFRFKSEIKDFSQLNTPKGESIDDREVEIALNLVSQLSKPFKPDNYRDTYNDELKRVIQEKVEGKIPSVHGTAPIPTPVPDLMEMLKKSLEAEKTKREKTR